MKKFLPLLFISISIGFTVNAQYVNLPDSNFRNYLRYQYPGCFNAAGQMDTTCSEIVNEDTLYAGIYTVINLEGLRYFKRLKYLDCSGDGYGQTIPALPDSLIYFSCSGSSGLDALPPLPSTLQYLNCSYLYEITSLPALPSGLKRLECINCWHLSVLPNLPPSLKYMNIDYAGQNSFSSPIVLPALPSGLDTLSCQQCLLTGLPALPGGIKYINCSGNPITSLPAFPNSISYLDCSGFKMNNWNFDDTSKVDLPPLPSNLKYFNCSNSGIRAMQPLPAGMEKLICNGVPISSSITFPSALTWLECAGCSMHSFPSLPDKITFLGCSGNPFHSIPSLPDSLTFLSCANDSLVTLPALPAGLTYIYCGSNQLTSLPGLPNSLNELICDANNLVSLPGLPGKLTSLRCAANRLTTLPALPDTLNYLQCNSNQLTSLPTLPRMLSNLNCSNNQLTYLPELNSSLSQLDCQGNNIYCLPKMPQFNFYCSISCDWKINCIPNTSPNIYVTRYDTLTAMSVSGLPLCNPTNNVSHCQAFPVMQGNVFFDSNNNGVKDANELLKNNTRVSLSNISYTFSNNNGQYEIAADSIGNYNLITVAPRYYKYAPASYNFNFINYDTLVTGRNFALQIDSIVDELTVRITPINWAARPGFSFPYLISYENTGTTTLNPTVVFNYDNTRLVYDLSSEPGVVDNGSSLTKSIGSFAPGESSSFIGYFTLKTTVNIGDSVHTNATIAANTFTVADSNVVGVRGAFDPNDKQATPQLSPSQVASGKYIDYTIRFQNTGTDTAFNIVISDTLNSGLLANSLQMTGSSHACKATVKDNIVFFEFLNILLPDSNVNEPKSHGFVSFSIKPQSNVAENTIIPNIAAIYFDYNSPVITNTATTEIKTPLIPVPLKLQSFTVVKQTENTAIILWNTSNEINTAKFCIEQSFDGRNFTNIAYENAKGRQYNTYSRSISIPATAVVYYRLRIIDIDGRFTYSPVVVLRKNKMTGPFTILNNPVKDILTIAVQDAGLRNTVVKIINVQGAVLQTAWLQNSIETVDISKLPAGVYILQTEKGSSQFMLVR